MFFQTSPFDMRAAFLYRNVCDFPKEMTADRIDDDNREEILEGLRYIRNLLLEMYEDIGTFLTDDPLESYHRLTHTVLLLYVAGLWGELIREGEASFLVVEKADLRNHFKKPAAFHLEALVNYGFYFEYQKNGANAESYKSCDTVIFHNESCISFFPALCYFVRRIPLMDSKKDYAMQSDLLMRADMKTVLLGGGKRKEDGTPLSLEILRTLGHKAELWTSLAGKLLMLKELKASVKFWSYCTPHWVIHWLRKGKPVCIFTLHTDTLMFEMAAPYAQLAAMAEKKDSLVPAIRRNLEGFSCIQCGKCEGGMMNTVNGIKLCTKQPWARRLSFEITSLNEAKAAAELIVT